MYINQLSNRFLFIFLHIVKDLFFHIISNIYKLKSNNGN